MRNEKPVFLNQLNAEFTVLVTISGCMRSYLRSGTKNIAALLAISGTMRSFHVSWMKG